MAKEEISFEDAQRIIPGGFTEADHAQAALSAFMERRPTPKLEFKKELSALDLDLPEYQQNGVHFTRESYQRGLINSDDMGLGKTVQTIRALRNEPGLKFVVCPAFLRRQWAEEIQKWANQTAYVWAPAAERKKEYAGETWIVAFYRAAEEAHRACIGYNEYTLIIDECHNLRGNQSQGNNIVQGVANFASGRVLLTGSLLINSGSKLWALLNLAQPQCWGTYYDFTARYCGGAKGVHGWEVKDQLFNVEELKNRLTFMSYRRTREDVPADQLPFETVYSTVWVDVPDKIGVDGLASLSINATMWAGYLERLNQAKNPIIADHIKSDQEAGIPSITFCFTKQQVAQLHGLVPNALAVTGTGPNSPFGVVANQRLAVIADYIKLCKSQRKTPALIATMDSLSEGANLQWAKAVNLATLDWTPEKLRQCVSRAARMGNTGKIAVRLFAARRSADEAMLELMKTKLRQSQRVIGSGNEVEKTKFINASSAEGGYADVLKAMYLRFKKGQT